MYLLKVRIQLYKDREWLSYIVTSFVTNVSYIEIITIRKMRFAWAVSEIYKVKVTAYKSIKDTGG
ncbi:hypothetical protein LCGC14_0771530 [marine sediment metagenome]|uniref:Uncharacterized protein n=1 Tax=marine sediment metagenome TaxID=412755 RepID=A0A0F9PY96_9ZZZZ